MTATRYDGAAFQALARTRYDGAAWQPLKSYRYDGAVFQEFAGPEAAEPVLASTPVASNQLSSLNTISVTMPATVTAGDQLVIFAVSRSTGAVFTATGWTVAKTNITNLSSAILAKTADGTEGGTTVAVAYTGTANKAIAAAVRLTGSRGLGPATTANGGGITSLAVPSVTTSGANRLLLGFWASTIAPVTWTPPGTMTQQLTSANGTLLSILVTTEDRPTAGSTGTRTASDTTSASMHGYLVPVMPNWA